MSDEYPSEESVEALIEEKLLAQSQLARELRELLQARKQARMRRKASHPRGDWSRSFFMQRVSGLVGVSDHMVREALRTGELGFIEPEGTGQQKSRVIFDVHLREWGRLLEKKGYTLKWLDDHLFQVKSRK